MQMKLFPLAVLLALLAVLVACETETGIAKEIADQEPELVVSAAQLVADFHSPRALRFHDPEAPLAYHIFRTRSYAGVIFVLLPLVIFTGLAMSPGMNAAWPWLLDIFGGRQSARSIHFIVAMLLAGFIIVHLALVILAGPLNEVRSMLTGKWRVPPVEGA